MTAEQYAQLSVPVNWDELQGLQNTIFPWRKESEKLAALIGRVIDYAGSLRSLHLNTPSAPQQRGPEPAARGVRVAITKDDGPADIYRNPDKYSVHTQRRFGLLPNQREKQPVKATG
ncbi:hypothetical protein PITCH_A200003 [uncultured Desulfobacterium sp.]|uniref:Uncharacterized protein n=1 Tax=uncultured Desulfobacterium sp. TaxID=201089 RepID=A0A445MT43_9BACT|nr:hypothetical protein PITCH_A1420001 [uncultured Desulfobacterium sp.]SPD73831.1 hypothetical protein PITCH_A200003 [uncultured Desulfobacterium sp.]